MQDYFLNSPIAKMYRKLSKLLAGPGGGQSVSDNFSLNSGERQTGATLAEIRHDHKVRYNFALNFLKQNDQMKHPGFGLDLFCGTGYGTYMVASALSCSMLGIDGSAEAITFANCNYAQDGTYYSYKEFPFTLPLNTFDFIICYESLEHVNDSQLLMQQLHSSLKDDGYLFLSIPNEKCFPFRKNFNPFHFKHYTMEEVMALIRSAGHYELLTWFGQDLYEIKDGKSLGPLKDHQMELHEMHEGQIVIYVLKKMVKE